MVKVSSQLKKFDLQRAGLISLLDEDPAKRSPKLVISLMGRPRKASCSVALRLKASIFNRGRSLLGRQDSYRKTYRRFRGFAQDAPGDPISPPCNIGSGFVALADLQTPTGFDWYLQMAVIRQKAR
jgi:hypothetical protein